MLKIHLALCFDLIPAMCSGPMWRRRRKVTGRACRTGPEAKNTVYLEMIYVGVRYMYFRAKSFQNKCILRLVFYTKWTVHLEASQTSKLRKFSRTCTHIIEILTKPSYYNKYSHI